MSCSEVVPEYAHLTEADVETLGAELDAIRRDIEAVRGETDVQYLLRTIAAQRGLEVAGRLMLLGAHKRGFWWGSAATLGVAKIIENMELGHNVMHGQWDWMNDPEVHSTTWEWDHAGTSRLWKHTHNYVHHKYTNVLDMDDDVGFKTIRVTRNQSPPVDDADHLDDSRGVRHQVAGCLTMSAILVTAHRSDVITTSSRGPREVSRFRRRGGGRRPGRSPRSPARSTVGS